MGERLRRKQLNKRLPLRKCLQCNEMKREDFHDRCLACHDANEQEYQRQREAGERFPANRNLIGWFQATSYPYLGDYLWYFLKWCFMQLTLRADHPSVKDEYL